MSAPSGGGSPKLAIALVAVLMFVLFVLAPACFLAGLIVALVGHPLIGLVLIVGSLVVGIGSLSAGVMTAIGAVRAAGDDAALRLGRFPFGRNAQRDGDPFAPDASGDPEGHSADPEDLRRADPDHDYIRGDYRRHED